VQHSFAHLSQLRTFEIYQQKRGRIRLDSQIWEEIIRSSLPLLKNFKFYFEFSLYTNILNKNLQIQSNENINVSSDNI